MASTLALSVLGLAMAAQAAPSNANVQNVQINEPRSSASSGCDEYHLFLARGNNEPYPGRQSNLVRDVCDGVASCGYEDLHYSAFYTDNYCQTVYDGTVAGHVQLAAYANRCPDSKLILGGYSQGAQIITDILGGGGGTMFNGCKQPETPALSRDNAPGDRIAAALVFGNTRHDAGQSYNYGNGSDASGLFPRPQSQLDALNAYADVLRDWCSVTDPNCAVNQTESFVYSHLSYYDWFSTEAAEWIQQKAGIKKDDPTFTTAIPTQISGYAEDYATATLVKPPSGIHTDSTWIEHTAVTATSTPVSSSSSSSSSSSAAKSSAAKSSAPASTAASATASSAASVAPTTKTSAAVVPVPTGHTNGTVVAPTATNGTVTAGSPTVAATTVPTAGASRVFSAGAMGGLIALVLAIAA